MATSLLIAFFAGCFASALGALNAVIMAGVVVSLGIVGGMAGVGYDLIGGVGFGLILGPHVSFGPACCAAAYAKRMGWLDQGKDIVTPLISLRRPSVLLVGGLFAVVGYFINLLVAAVLPGGIDSIAASITLTAILAKILFTRDRGSARLFGATPVSVRIVGGRFSLRNTEMWLPVMSTGPELLVTGGIIGGLSSVMTYEILAAAAATGNAALAGVAIFPGWAIGVVCLGFLIGGLQIPIFHHIALVSSYATAASFGGSGGDTPGALAWGIAFGILAAYVGSLWARTICSYGETFIDPPSAAIVICSILPLFVLPKLNAFSTDSVLNHGIPYSMIIAAVVIALIHHRKLSNANNSNTSTTAT